MSGELPGRCAPCTRDTPPLAEAAITGYLAGLDGWERDGDPIVRRYVLGDFRAALKWVNRVGMLAEEQGHHPDILISGYRNVQLTLTTHAIGGLSVNDFVLARKVDALASRA
ncbi:MAG: 4a-hydroxytetrahydrobiopterin dehydratase [bacterium]|nr:4a-hydroxytetrahydrobiopterin dehydratase [bacterium]